MNTNGTRDMELPNIKYGLAQSVSLSVHLTGLVVDIRKLSGHDILGLVDMDFPKGASGSTTFSCALHS